ELGVARVKVEELVLVLGELEEVRRLLEPRDRLARMQRALVARLNELLLRLEPLATDAVPTLVVAEVDVAARLDLRPQLGDETRVALLVGADEIVGLDLELGPRLFEARAHRLD